MARRYATLMLASRLQREIDQLFRDIGHAAEALDSGDWQPAIDVFETETAVYVLAELPGLATADLELLVEGNLLVLRGRKQPPQAPPARARFQCVETGHGTFERRLRIDAPVNTHRASAALRDGLLTIALPRVADRRRQSRAVKIQDG
jgi:HSP20 family protein